MHTFIKRALVGTLLAGGITLLGATVANAAETTGEDGLLSGNQALIDVSAPVSIVDNALSVIGDSTVVEAPPAPVTAPAPAPPAPAEANTSGEDGIASGNQAIVSVDVPVTVTDNAVSVIGDSTVVNTAPAPATAPTEATAPNEGPVTTGEDGILSGNQVLASVTAPITVSGNAVSGIGDSTVVGRSHGTTTVKAGAEGRLFGSVKTGDIADAVKAAGLGDLDKRKIHITTPIKSVGEHEATIRLRDDLTAVITLVVVAAK